MRNLEGAVSLVLGGGTGIGREVALALADHGSAVGIAGPTGNEAEVARSVETTGVRALATCTVIDTAEAVARAFEVARRLGPIDCVVLAHVPDGSLVARDLDNVNADMWDAQCEGLLRSTLHCLQQARREFEGREGRVILLCPTIVLTGASGLVPYLTAAEAQRVLFKSAARRWGRSGITLNTVAVAAEDMLEDLGGGERALEPFVGASALDHTTNLRRDIGPAVAFLASKASRYVTGVTMCLDGGAVMAP